MMQCNVCGTSWIAREANLSFEECPSRCTPRAPRPCTARSAPGGGRTPPASHARPPWPPARPAAPCPKCRAYIPPAPIPSEPQGPTEEPDDSPPPWTTSKHRKLETIGTPNGWTIKRHEFPDPPYEGDLDEEWGIYPADGGKGPIALVAGEENARFIMACVAARASGGVRERAAGYIAARDAWFSFIHDKSIPRDDATLDRLGDEHDAALSALRAALSETTDGSTNGGAQDDQGGGR
jgi:hypothetical protein